jgi:hypothetical protein
MMRVVSDVSVLCPRAVVRFDNAHPEAAPDRRATSGVIGRFGVTGYGRLRPGITGSSSVSPLSEPVLTGYDRPARGTACVADVWCPSCQH